MADKYNIQLNDSFTQSPIAALSHPLHPINGVAPDTGREHINILTYNIFLRPPPIKNNESDHKDDRLKEFIKLLPEFDIICLQEMFGFLNKRKHKLIRCATKAGFHYYADSPSPSFFTSFLVDGGLCVLSRFPIMASEFKPYPYGVFSDSLSQKGVLYTKIQIKDEVVHLYSTHMQASYFGENQRYPILTRADQFATLRGFIDTTLQKNGYRTGEMVLMVGDFNVDSRKPFIETTKISQYAGFKEYPHLGAGQHFNEYEAMKCFLSKNGQDPLDDLLFMSHGEHPITYADTFMAENEEMKPLETVLTDKDDLCSNQSLDYMFRLYPKFPHHKKKNNDLEENQPLQKQSKLFVKEKSAKVEKFFISDQTFTQLSDHYGSMMTLEYGFNKMDRRLLHSHHHHSLSEHSHQQVLQSYNSSLTLD